MTLTHVTLFLNFLNRAINSDISLPLPVCMAPDSVVSTGRQVHSPGSSVHYSWHQSVLRLQVKEGLGTTPLPSTTPSQSGLRLKGTSPVDPRFVCVCVGGTGGGRSALVSLLLGKDQAPLLSGQLGRDRQSRSSESSASGRNFLISHHFVQKNCS